MAIVFVVEIRRPSLIDRNAGLSRQNENAQLEQLYGNRSQVASKAMIGPLV